MIRICTVLAIILLIHTNIYAQSPRLLDPELDIRSVAEAPFESIKISYNTVDDFLYLITRNGNIHRVSVENGLRTVVQNSSHHGMSDVQGLAISTEGTFFIVGNVTNQQNATNTAYVKRGVVSGGQWEWETVFETEPYPLSNTDFDHMMNEIVISPDGGHLYINSGSRTDHGEIQSADGRYPGLREAPLTARILKVPSDATGLILQNDDEFLTGNGYVFADGTRNSFGLAFNADGKLFAPDNSGERDDPEEFNWLREGHHYGFPWYAGGNTNPMQFDGYDPSQDLLISTDARDEIFYNDPDFPPPPDGAVFTDPILNHGPDAVHFRDPDTGEIRNAAGDGGLRSFTAHRSLLGLKFDADSVLAAPYTGDALILSFTGGNDNPFLLQHMDDDGEDLMHIRLTKIDDDTYEMSSTILADRFLNPIDSELVGNKLYVIEFKTSWLNNFATTRIWEITIPENQVVSLPQHAGVPAEVTLHQNYPNPFNPTTIIRYTLPESNHVVLEVYDQLGRSVQTLVNGVQASGPHNVSFTGSGLPAGVYFYRLHMPGSGNAAQIRKMTLLK